MWAVVVLFLLVFKMRYGSTGLKVVTQTGHFRGKNGALFFINCLIINQDAEKCFFNAIGQFTWRSANCHLNRNLQEA